LVHSFSLFSSRCPTVLTMAKLTDLPLETLNEIAKLSGWSLPFRLTCKQVSNAYTGPVYKYETSLARFYHDCSRTWRPTHDYLVPPDMEASALPIVRVDEIVYLDS